MVVFDQLKPGGWEVQEVAGIEGWIADTDTVQTVAVVTGGGIHRHDYQPRIARPADYQI